MWNQCCRRAAGKNIYLFTMFNHQQSLGKISKEFTFILISSMHLVSKTTFSLRCRCRCVVAVASFHFLVGRIGNPFMARDFKSYDMTVHRTMKIRNICFLSKRLKWWRMKKFKAEHWFPWVRFNDAIKYLRIWKVPIEVMNLFLVYLMVASCTLDWM